LPLLLKDSACLLRGRLRNISVIEPQCVSCVSTHDTPNAGA